VQRNPYARISVNAASVNSRCVNACLDAEAESGVDDKDAEQEPRQWRDSEERLLNDEVNRRVNDLKPNKVHTLFHALPMHVLLILLVSYGNFW